MHEEIRRNFLSLLSKVNLDYEGMDLAVRRYDC